MIVWVSRDFTLKSDENIMVSESELNQMNIVMVIITFAFSLMNSLNRGTQDSFHTLMIHSVTDLSGTDLLTYAYITRYVQPKWWSHLDLNQGPRSVSFGLCLLSYRTIVDLFVFLKMFSKLQIDKIRSFCFMWYLSPALADVLLMYREEVFHRVF